MRYPRLAGLLAVPVAAGSLLAGHVGGTDSNGAPCTTALLNGRYALVGPGSFGGLDLTAVETLLFDGAGHVSGRGTAVIDEPFQVIPFEAQQGTYVVRPDCTATMRWFGHHPTLASLDHFHNADVVIGDGGRQMSLVYTTTEFPGGGPPVPIESFTFTGRRL